MEKVQSILKYIFLCLVKAYRFFLSPYFGNQCRFHPTCSKYAEQALKVKPIHTALYLTLKRLFKCNPFFEGGYDPIPKHKEK